MNRERMKKMLDCIDNKYIAEAKQDEKSRNWKYTKFFAMRKVAVAAVIGVGVMGIVFHMSMSL